MAKMLLTWVLSLLATIAAASIQYEGLNYELNAGQNTAVVLASECADELVIPETIVVDGKNYTVTGIGKCAFQRCSQLTTVTIPKTIKNIGAKAFANGNIISINISDLCVWCSMAHEYLYHTTGGQYIYEPIGNYRLFLNGSEINTLEIPSNVTYLSTNSFAGCKNISKVIMHDNLSTIGDYAFYKCDALSKIEFGNNVTSIGEYCFYNCGLLENIELPKSLRELKIGALLSLNLKEITIPGNVTKIGSGCFLDCQKLTTVKFEDSDLDIALGYGQYNGQPLFIGCPLQKIYLGRNFKEKTMSSSIGYSVSPFSNQTGLTTVTIGDNVKSIGPNLFEDCSSLSEIKLPQSLEKIETGAFKGCSSLSEINTPQSLKIIKEGAFDGCDKLPILDNIQYAGNCAIKVTDRDLECYNLAKDTKMILSSCFFGCTKLGKIDLPSSIVYWGDNVFGDCTNLTEISIPDKVKEIGESMFYGCENLKQIIIPSNIETIYAGAFAGCKSLTEMVIPQSVRRIGDSAFKGCTSLRKIVIEDCSESIGMGTNGYNNKALFDDNPIEEVYLGRNMSSSYWDGTRNDYLPFYGKETIKKLTIGAEVTNLWAYSFYGCNAIEDIYVMQENPMQLKNYTFSSELYSKCRLNVPVNSVSLYASADIWRNFDKIVGCTTGIQNVSSSLDSACVNYNLDGIVSNKGNRRGIKIIKNKNGKYIKVFSDK